MFANIFLTGTVGAGKSTTADEIALLLAKMNRAHAVIDLDALRRNWPANESDPFNHEIELQNLSCIARNYIATGADIIILAGVLEDRDEIVRYREACGGGPMSVCRLTVDEDVGQARLGRRHGASKTELKWHLERFEELSSIIDGSGAYDVAFDTSTMTPQKVAAAVLHYSNPEET